mgnify:CR=1 FL=1
MKNPKFSNFLKLNKKFINSKDYATASNRDNRILSVSAGILINENKVKYKLIKKDFIA